MIVFINNVVFHWKILNSQGVQSVCIGNICLYYFKEIVFLYRTWNLLIDKPKKTFLVGYTYIDYQLNHLVTSCKRPSRLTYCSAINSPLEITNHSLICSLISIRFITSPIYYFRSYVFVAEIPSTAERYAEFVKVKSKVVNNFCVGRHKSI